MNRSDAFDITASRAPYVDRQGAHERQDIPAFPSAEAYSTSRSDDFAGVLHPRTYPHDKQRFSQVFWRSRRPRSI
jgi:hypothetical protein